MRPALHSFAQVNEQHQRLENHAHVNGMQAVARAAQGAVLRESDRMVWYGSEKLAVIRPGTNAPGEADVATRGVAAVSDQAIHHNASDAALYRANTLAATVGLAHRNP